MILLKRTMHINFTLWTTGKYYGITNQIVSLFDLMIFIPVNNFSVMPECFPNWTSTKERIKRLIQGHNTVPLESLEPATKWSKVKHCTTGFL